MTDRQDASWRAPVALVLASSTGGVGQHVLSLVRGLVAAGCPVLVCGPAATDQLFGFTAAGARFAPVEIPAMPGPQDAGAVRALRRALTGTPPVTGRPAASAAPSPPAGSPAGATAPPGPVAVVHAHGLRAAFVAALARPGVPLVVTLHNAVLARGLRGHASNLVEKVVARSADVILGASDDLVERARKLGARDARPGPVAAPAGAPPRRSRAAVRAEFGIPARTPLILSVGRLHPQKRYDVLVDAAARWRALDPAPVVVIAGSGPSYMALAQKASALRAPVTLLGHRGDVPDLLAGADLAVITSDWEARQLFAQEALRAGLPLVATAVGGLPGLVGDAAKLVPPGDVDAVDTAVRELLADPALRERYAERARQQAASWPGEADTVAAVRAVYADVTARASATGGATGGAAGSRAGRP
ncbi:glycosyltransferase family 4 protein [Spirilliplanes yamanashiensis]|uniref:Glycosyl transferase n=1 Tax=Spirilliplanes yamanashiensis TaxID=42233 RepID=A0A8J4DLG1_9ACTN|nr:glycosyltransferase family 4 protein [Spirilliplanes yamanashiensis]MDP9818544.1 glycosyltransferase involved in cell wall biosynthesis [Spirilliplanes yamanashiensis]GIJ06327.1 glycosyl transferase [Spirilliplanes yamanashiensis]